MIKVEQELVKKYLEDVLLPGADLTDNILLNNVGLDIFKKNGKGVLKCPTCSSDTSYFSGTTATRCNSCGTISISTYISENAKSIFTIKNLAESVKVTFDFKQFQTRPEIALRDVKDFLNAQLPSNFVLGLKSAGWIDDEISKASIGSVGVDSEYLWERFIGHDHMDKYTDFCRYKGYFYMPFYDGDKINAVILPPDFTQNDIWSHIGYTFLYPPKFDKIWHSKANLKSKVIAVSNPLYAIYLIVQGKPAFFVHGHSIKIEAFKKNMIYVFEGDTAAKKSIGEKAQIIPEIKGAVDLGIWATLKNIDLNKEKTDWITKISAMLKSGVSLSDAIDTYEKTEKVRFVVRPVP